MFSRELSFAPDRRSINDSFYRFGSGSSRYDQGLSGQDPRYKTFDDEYREKYTGFRLSENNRRNLIDIILEKIPIDHLNVSFLAAANYGVWLARKNSYPWNPDTFKKVFDHLSNVLVKNVKDKSPEEVQLLLAKYQTNFYRYMEYVREHTRDMEVAQEEEVEVEIVESPGSEERPSRPVSRPKASRPKSRPKASRPVARPAEEPEEITVTLEESTPSQAGEELPLTSFEDIQSMLLAGSLVEYNLAPEYDYLTTSPNQIMIFNDAEGLSYLSAVQYDEATGEIFPPVR